jgi:hypothetical protein
MSKVSGADHSWRDFTRVSPARSFFLMGCGALLGLGLAGYSLFTARGTSTLRVPPEAVALVNQQPISRSDYLAQMQTLYGVDPAHATRAERAQVLEDMIREELFVQRGKELDLVSSDPETRAALVNAVELEIAADAITAQPSEAALRAYYEVHRTRYVSEGTMRLRDLVFAPGDAAGAARAVLMLKSATPGAPLPGELQARDSGKIADEEFYFAARIHLGERLFEAAQRLGDGAVCAPIETADGIHVLYMLENRVPARFAYEAARDQVLKDYRNDAIAHLRTGDELFLRRRANVLIADDLR